MTDFFAELEHHLVDAARRERRARLRAGPLVAAAVIAVGVAVAIAAWPAADEREIGAQGPTPTPAPTGCAQPTDDAPPARWSDTLAVLARPASEVERAFAQRLPIALAEQGAYRNFARLARVVDGSQYWLVPVKNVMRYGECPGPRRETRGVCLYIVEAGNGKLQNCSMPAGIRTLLEWMARPLKGGHEIVGVMPNGVATMRMHDPALGTRTFDVVGNVVVGRVRARDRFALDDARWSFFDARGREVSGVRPGR
jgi:hypothetical protein